MVMSREGLAKRVRMEPGGPIARVLARVRGALAHRCRPLLAGIEPSSLTLGRWLIARGAPSTLICTWLTGPWVAQSIAVAARLEIADRLRDGPKSCTELAAEIGAHAPSLYRLMRALASLGLFDEDRQGRFVATRLGRSLERGAPDSIHSLAEMVGSDWHWQSWGALLHTVRTGQPAFDHVMGAEAYTYFARHPDDGVGFSAHVDAYARRAARAILAYDFTGVRTVVDVGGGYGAVITSILQANPSLCAVVFDLDAVVVGARPRIAALGLADRCALVAGSFFEAVPDGGDLYLLSSILHNWDDERAGAILRTCRRAMGAGSRMLIVEQAIAPGNTPGHAKFLDLQMMVICSGGKERTTDEYRTLLSGAGLRLTRRLPTTQQFSLIEAVCA